MERVAPRTPILWAAAPGTLADAGPPTDARAWTRPPAHPWSDERALIEQGAVEGSPADWDRAPSSEFIDWPHHGV
jgi:hypothetical protein